MSCRAKSTARERSGAWATATAAVRTPITPTPMTPAIRHPSRLNARDQRSGHPEEGAGGHGGPPRAISASIGRSERNDASLDAGPHVLSRRVERGCFGADECCFNGGRCATVGRARERGVLRWRGRTRCARTAPVLAACAGVRRVRRVPVPPPGRAAASAPPAVPIDCRWELTWRRHHGILPSPVDGRR
jgi:hypothetical protein